MIPSVELGHAHKHMSQAMFCATSPQCWQRSMSQTLKSSYSAMYGYQWLKDIKIEPQLNHEPLLGKYLGLVVDTSVDDPKEQASKPSFQRKPAPPATDTAKKKTNPQQTWTNTSKKFASETSTNKEKTKSARSSQKSESKAERQLSQVMLQQKTAKVTFLRDWMQKSSSAEQVISPTLLSEPSYKNPRSDKQFVKTSTSDKSKTLTAQACDSSKWQQQIGRNIQKIINRVVPSNVSLLGRKKRQLQRNSIIQNATNTLPLWQQTLVIDNLNVQASLDLLQCQFEQTEQLKKHSDSSNKGTAGFVDQIVKSKFQRSISPQDNAAPQQKQVVKPPSSLITNDKRPTTLLCSEVEMAKPEFPPVSKMINEQLQVSGKHTALKHETQLFAPHEHDMDDEKLAEALKRIIDQQARRHGINV